MLHVIQPVVILFFLHISKPPFTYGVDPDADIPITKSFSLTLCFVKSNHASEMESSANSWDTLIALSPPAIIPIILSPIPKVGKHSDASTIPNLPLVPDPI